MDACDNVYVCDYSCEGACNDTCIYRMSAEGLEEPDILIYSNFTVYIPNFDWGGGIGGWDSRTLYMPHGWYHWIYHVDIGVPSKPKVFP